MSERNLEAIILVTSWNQREQKMILEWNAVDDASGYHIQIATDNRFKEEARNLYIKGAKTTQIALKRFQLQTGYYARVQSYQQLGKKKLFGEYSLTQFMGASAK